MKVKELLTVIDPDVYVTIQQGGFYLEENFCGDIKLKNEILEKMVERVTIDFDNIVILL